MVCESDAVVWEESEDGLCELDVVSTQYVLRITYPSLPCGSTTCHQPAVLPDSTVKTVPVGSLRIVLYPRWAEERRYTGLTASTVVFVDANVVEARPNVQRTVGTTALAANKRIFLELFTIVLLVKLPELVDGFGPRMVLANEPSPQYKIHPPYLLGRIQLDLWFMQ